MLACLFKGSLFFLNVSVMNVIYAHRKGKRGKCYSFFSLFKLLKLDFFYEYV